MPPPEELACPAPLLASGRTPVVEPALLPSDESAPDVTTGTSVPVPAPATAAVVAPAMSMLDPIVESTVVLPGGSVIDTGGETVLSVPLSVLGPAVVSESTGELLIPEIGEPQVEEIVVVPTMVVPSSLVSPVLDTVIEAALV